MLQYCHQNAQQNHDIKMANSSFKNVAQAKYLGTTVTNKLEFHSGGNFGEYEVW
jgi:hypothetical protein